MIRAFFEGPAGSGKTHHLIAEAVTAAKDVLVDPNQKLLALTFMNGARHRLNLRFRDVPQLRSRFVCLTFDSFARMVVHRRRSVLRALSDQRHAPGLSEFDRTCIDAARLLEILSVSTWVAMSYPLVVVDEAQDLSPHRFRILKALGETTCLIAAADEFQNLNEDIDSSGVVTWLRGANKAVELTQIRRTSKDGLLRVAGALRGGIAVCESLQFVEGPFAHHKGAGMKLIECPAKNTGRLAWTVADELSAMRGDAVVLTPDMKGTVVRNVLRTVHSEAFNRNKAKGIKFGPFPLSLERREEEDASELLSCITGDGPFPLRSVIEAIAALKKPVCRHVCDRLERARNVRGETEVRRERLGEIICDVLRDISRFHFRSVSGRRVMTIHQAKNREFREVVVLWPHTATGTPHHQRRLLYNAITRAQDRCSVVIFGQGRAKKAPFASGASDDESETTPQ
jgi:hypothetical protein